MDCYHFGPVCEETFSVIVCCASFQISKVMNAMQAVDVAPTDAQQVLIGMPRRPITANGKGFTILG